MPVPKANARPRGRDAVWWWRAAGRLTIAGALVLVGMACEAVWRGSLAQSRRLVIDLALKVDGAPVGDVTAEFDARNRLMGLRADGLLEHLSERIEPAAERDLRARVDGAGLLTLTALGAAGLEARYDERQLVVEVAIPARLKPVTQIGLRGRRPSLHRDGLTPTADFSSLLNLRTGLDYVHESPGGIGDGRRPVNARVDWATNVMGVVLENDLFIAEEDDHPLQRETSRLVFDDPEDAVRYAAGDLFYPVTGFQSFQSMGGLTLARNFDLQPYRITTPAGRQDFVLLRDSQVEVLINGRRSELLRLPAGRYDVRDFPVARGGNDVQLRITDPSGQVSTIDLSVTVSNNLLAAGLQEYAYSIGLPSYFADGERVYEERFPAFSAFHRIGLSDDLTVGANLQGDGRVQMVGAEAIWATRFGVFSVDLAGSLHERAGPGAALTLAYELLGNSSLGGADRSLSAAVTYRSRDFTALGGAGGDNPVALDGFVRFNQRLNDGIRLGIGAGYQVGQAGARDTHDVNLSLSRDLTDNVTLEVGLGHMRHSDGENEVQGFVSLSWQLPEGRQYALATHDTATRSTRLDWQYLAEKELHDPDVNLFAVRSEDDYGFGGSLFFDDYHFDASLAHEFAAVHRSGGGYGRDIRSSVRLGTALLFADGAFAISRPVYDSFVLVGAHPQFEGQNIGLDPIGGQFRGRIDALGPAVLPDVSSYQVRTVRVDAPDLPLGYDLGQDTFQVQPGYRSGTLIRVGTGATVLLDGTLVSADGAPLALLAGTARYLDDETMAPLDFFTNRSGRFRMDGVRPGRYALRLLQWPDQAVPIEVPAGASGLLRLDPVVVPVKIKQ